METARRNPELPLSRLYRWTGRVLLKGNSEAGFLLLVPLRSYDGTVFGLCGIEVSDRMFKYLYSPGTSDYTDVFSVLAPYSDNLLHTESGLVAGNHYLTGFWPEEHLLSLIHIFPPQAARESTITRANNKAISFFIVVYLLKFSGQS